MSSYSIHHIAALVGGQIEPPDAPDYHIEQLLYDSRQIIFPETGLFFALSGPQQDGHNFIAQAYKAGVRSFIIDKAIAVESLPEASFIRVADTLAALQQLANYHRHQFDLPVIGITGSNGKTIIKEWLFQLLREDYQIVKSPRSFNSQLGVSLSVWQIGPQHELGIFEAGISTSGEMQRLAPIIDCRIGLFTNIGEAHREGFPDTTTKITEKLTLFKNAEILIYCRDDHRLDASIKASKIPTFSWSVEGAADLQITGIQPMGKATKLVATYQQQALEILIPFNEPTAIENTIHCWAVLLYLGVAPAVIAHRILQLDTLAMRLELKEGINNCILINDSYNADLTSLTMALQFLQQQKKDLRRTLILSDILQSGLTDRELYGQIAQLISTIGIHRLIGIGQYIPTIDAQLSPEIEHYFFSDTASLLSELSQFDFQNEIILLKGARPFGFEAIAERLSRQVHRTRLEVNLNALAHNLRIMRNYLLPTTKLMVMVKAAAYGSGSLEIARALEFHQVDYLGVAYTDEGVDLRRTGIHLPILVLNPEPAAYDALLRYQLEPEVYSLQQLRELARFCQGQGSDLTIHLKLDTGMHRLGFESQHVDELCEILKHNPQLKVRSIFSHLAASEADTHDPFTHQQVSRFQQDYQRITATLAYRPLRHTLNSAGIVRFPQYQMDLVRLGIGIYGVGSATDQLKPVMQLKATVSQIKELAPGETVGYGRHGILKQGGKIATISVGYADGLSRRAGNGRYSLLVRGQLAPIVGNVCMDMCMVEVTHIAKVQEGDEVIVFGEMPRVETLAEALETIPYEVFTNISPRVKRVYVQD
ncbi:MAG: bifunctional UDP-N-acetylmuramoyl-tripeptide:D-alanyl-D-alanine ligase/alanine racemase [Saprospiraceae bacterium]|nr:MAG: bifunctional UDP-N-acetylmuramoyl-tripeptide:D-alanyl-D-alanine ligase/alanine racemase [Saprospiraceae bacterium]